VRVAHGIACGRRQAGLGEQSVAEGAGDRVAVGFLIEAAAVLPDERKARTAIVVLPEQGNEREVGDRPRESHRLPQPPADRRAPLPVPMLATLEPVGDSIADDLLAAAIAEEDEIAVPDL